MAQNDLTTLLESKAKFELIADGFEKWLHWGAAIVAVGVIIEAVWGYRAYTNNKKLHGIQDSIDGYRLSEIARLNEQASQAQQKANEARLALEKLKAHLAWRTLNIRQAKKLTVLLRKSPGKFRITYADDNPEQKAFARNMIGSFIVGEWTDVGDGIKQAPSSLGLFDVFIFGTPWSVNFVGTAFQEVGITFNFEHGIPVPDKPSENEEVEIRICEKTPYPWAELDK